VQQLLHPKLKEETMTIPKFITIDGKRHLWRDLVQQRGAQLLACSRAQQPALFELKEDHRPAADRSAAGRYLEPSLSTLIDRES
jgi:hypothetical protein